jgi:cytochrome c oxidase subunit 2
MSGDSVTVDENYVRNSILNPGSQIVSPYANVMPSFQGQLKEREVRAMIEFIKRLNEVVDEQGEPKIDLQAQGGGSTS